MSQNLAQRILSDHLVSGKLEPGTEVGIRIDQTLTQDATGTMACLQFEALAVDRVKTELSVSYVDHNMLQSDFRNADDHRFLQTIAAKYGIYFSRPGNGVCHQVHLERFAKPGKTLLGSDSHTPTAGGLCMIAIGAGGLDVAVAMAGGPFYLPCPLIVGVELTGALPDWVSAKDVILELLRRLTVKGGVGRIFEYCGPGVAALDVPSRATITNMGAELGATTSLFPSDERSHRFLSAQWREQHFVRMLADPDAGYDEVLKLDLSSLEPLVAQPHMPDRVVPVRELSGQKVDQVCVGSCTNSSYRDMHMLAAMLKGKHIAETVNLTVSPGSKQVLAMMAQDGSLHDIISAGARVLESSCGPCIGMGQAPPSGAVSVRTFNRNFVGRSGTRDAMLYLASPEVAAACALTGEFTDPRTLGEYPRVAMPDEFSIDDSDIIAPAPPGIPVEVLRGPNIAPLQLMEPMPADLTGKVLLKVGDDITTDHIMPAGARVLPFRSNIPKIAEFVYEGVDPDFVSRAKSEGGGIIVGGANYGQGSSREHAGLAPAFLGIRVKIVKSFARIHRANLINFGILPLILAHPDDYDVLEQGHDLSIADVQNQLQSGANVTVKDLTAGKDIACKHDLSEREVEIIIAGGKLNYTRQQMQEE
ncbi:MAG: aconitate hydratase [Candidatus Riflebacteria bacterium RBG_13_59_9]|nr:MAG: aconitate hydratase [Candidatus Riflebacteria bacterium RBG_13_59_9]